jgi:predicted ABC-type ATPase
MLKRRNVHIHLTRDYDPSEPRKGRGQGGGQWTKGGGGGGLGGPSSSELTKAQGRALWEKLQALPMGGVPGGHEYAEEEQALMQEEEAEGTASGIYPYPNWREGGEAAISGTPIGQRTGGATHIHLHRPEGTVQPGKPEKPPWRPRSFAGQPYTHGPMNGELTRLNGLRDDPSLTSEQVAATAPASQISELSETRAHMKRDQAMRGDTEKRNSDPARWDKYSRDREHLHKGIMKKGRRGPDDEHPGQTKMYEGLLSPEVIRRARPEPGQKPTLTLLGGRGGSGKSWFKGKLYDPDHALVLDADKIKHMLPEFTGDNAWEVHEESSHILDRTMKVAKRLGLNIVLDATMKTGPKLLAMAQGYKDAGYKVDGHFMHLPRLKAAQRAIDRRFSPGVKAAKEGGDPSLRGRYVDPDVILQNVDNEKNFEALTKIADNWSAWDNDVGRGEQPKLIARGGNY